MFEFSCRSVALAGAALLLALGTPVAAEDTGTIEEIVAILRNEGLIDEATQQKLLVKHASEEQKKKTAGVLGGLEWSGDLRLRHEAFWFDGDATGTPEPDNRYRFRYRARLGFQKQLGDRIRVGMHLASGVGSNRGANVSFGELPDFRPDDIFIDQAWVELQLGDGPVDTRLVLGKVANPFLWRVGLDRLMWDPDITPEGGYIQARQSFGERSELWATLGAFIAKENSGVVGSKSDPKVFVLQLGASRWLTDGIEVGGRVSGYEWRSLDRPFIERAKLFGNLDSAFDGKARIGELSAYARFTAADAWPVLLHGSFERNFTADSALIGGVPTDAEDIAWGAGFEVGDATKNAKLGFTFFRVEANAIVATFADSDVLDGQTNREGFVAYASRKLGPHVELRLTFYDAEEIRSSSPFAGSLPPINSLRGADRRRLQSDLLVTF